jgi:hypothetical protein
MTDKMTVKACKTSKPIMVQLLQTGTDEKPSSKTVSLVLLIFYNSINDKTMFQKISNIGRSVQCVSEYQMVGGRQLQHLH